MQKITQPDMFSGLTDGNVLVGSAPEMVNSSVVFSGKGNIIFCEDNVRLKNSVINFNGDNSIVYLCSSRHDYIINISVNNDNVFYSGRNNYFNGVVNAILSEQKHVFIGNNCLFSFGIWIRNADPHLIYDATSRQRINPTRSIFIGDSVWIGQSAMILKGTEICSGSIIGAMSVVSGKKIGANSSWAGNPVRKLRENIFWDGACVHRWDEEKTKNSQLYKNDDYIFSYQKEEYIPFSFVDEQLNTRNSKEKKLEYLNFISADKSKNRFVTEPENPGKLKLFKNKKI